MKQKLSLSLFLLLTLCHAQALERRVALVIGNSDYTYLAKLNNASNDAKDMSAKLSQMGFEVITGINQTKQQLHDKIKAFDKKIRQGDITQTVALFYYAGHGLEVAGDNYVVPIDAQMEYQEDAQYQGIQLEQITASMQYTNSKLNVIILDACRNNPLPKRNRSLADGWGAINNAVQGTFIAFGTSPGKQANDSDGRGRNGLFTKFLLKYIDKPDYTLEQIFKSVRGEVLKNSGNKQLTWQNNATVGDYYFSKSSSKINNQTNKPINNQTNKPTNTPVNNSAKINCKGLDTDPIECLFN